MEAMLSIEICSELHVVCSCSILHKSNSLVLHNVGFMRVWLWMFLKGQMKFETAIDFHTVKEAFS